MMERDVAPRGALQDAAGFIRGAPAHRDMIERYTPEDIGRIFSEESKFQRFLEIELLTVEAQERLKLFPRGTAKRIRAKAKILIPAIKKIEEKTHHDMVSFVLNLSESLGNDKQYVHQGLTSSDVLDTALAWQMKDVLAVVFKDLENLLKEAKKKAVKYKDTLCVARTHGVHAEVYSFGLKFVFFHDELRREKEWLQNAAGDVLVGKISGSAGTYAHCSPAVEEYVCRKIGIKPASFSTQIVPRERLAFLFSIFSLIAGSLERFATEVRHLQKTETAEAEEPFYPGQKGSSSMPHKRNPIICERICGLARVIRGNMVAAFENINLWHERDISHSSAERVIIPDTCSLLVYMLRKMTEVVKHMKVHPEAMLSHLNLGGGLIYSQRLLLELTRRGMGRPKAYDIVQNIALECMNEGSSFCEKARVHPEVKKTLRRKEIDELFNPGYYLNNIEYIYKKAGIG